ncbi:MAG TPA: AIR synthase-related protein [Phycisphaerales bacterium]|nr:AIR synthase-related protein [Phycisphaerales bacterium]
MPTTSIKPPAAVHRVEVRPVAGQPDPSASNALLHAKRRGLAPVAVRSAKVYLIEGSLDHAAVAGIASELLVDPVTERAIAGAGEPTVRAGATIEVHALPGVMDPAAQSVREAIYELTGERVEVSTGLRYDIEGVDGPAAVELARSAFANPAVHQIREGVWRPERLPKGDEYKLHIRRVTLRGLDDASLAKLSRDAHLFLNVAEMRAVQAEFDRLGRDPTDIELETIAQTWSEHCVHKTLKATIRYTSGVPAGSDVIAWATLPGHTVNQDGSVTITNLLKSTIAAATHELIADGVDWALSVFKDNSGVVALDDTWGVNIKVETHNRPSAIEPYGGAATGIGGCIRDVIGTGLGAKPIASTDVFCVADPARWHEPGKLAAAEHRSNEEDSRGSLALPPGVLHPRRILADVVAGVRDYGNRMGIPTVSGGVFFDDRYVGNPLVFCGCIGLIPRSLIKGAAKPGDRIIAMGGRTGRDGIHGATFSSAELASTSASEFAHAVQIGNAIEEKRLLDAVLRARDAEGGPLYHGITDCGAGGFSSAVGEMGGELGARVTLENAPTKYAGLSYTEVWISEAQERMVLAVPPENIGALQRICDEEHVEIADLGEFGTPGAELILTWRGAEVGRMPMAFLHEGIPNPTREAVWKGSGRADERTRGVEDGCRITNHGPRVGAVGPGRAVEAARPPDHRQQALDRPSVRPRGAGEHGCQAAGRSGDARARRRGGRRARRGERARHRPLAGPAAARRRRGARRGPVLDGLGEHRRVRAQPRLRRRGPGARRDPRQLLLGELRQAGEPGRACPRGRGVLRRGQGVPRALRERQGLPLQPDPLHRSRDRRAKAHRDPADAPHHRHRHRSGRLALRYDGREEARTGDRHRQRGGPEDLTRPRGINVREPLWRP